MKKFLYSIIFILFVVPTGVYTECASNEIFSNFYEKFKVDHKFRIDRTLFPVKVTIYLDEDPDVNTKVIHVAKSDVTSGSYKLYPNYEIMKSEGYVEIFEEISEEETNLLIGPPASEAAVSYIFKKIEGCWYLIEHYDFWGS